MSRTSTGSGSNNAISDTIGISVFKHSPHIKFLSRIFPLITVMQSISKNQEAESMVMLGEFINFLQHVAFVLNPHYDAIWGYILGSEVSTAIFTSHLPFYDRVWNPAANVLASFYGLLLTLFVLVATIVASHIVVAVTAARTDRYSAALFSLNRVILRSLSTWMWIPFMNTVIAPLVCITISSGNAPGVDGNVGSFQHLIWHFAYLPTSDTQRMEGECQAGHHVAFIVLAAIIITIGVPLLFTVRWCEYVCRSDSPHLKARRHWYADMLDFMHSALMCILFQVLISRGLHGIFSALLAVTSVVVAGVYIFYLPYYNHAMNYWYVTMHLTAAFTGILTCVASYNDNWYAMMVSPVLLLGGFPILVIACRVLTDWRINPRFLRCLQMCKVDGKLASVRFVNFAEMATQDELIDTILPLPTPQGHIPTGSMLHRLRFAEGIRDDTLAVFGPFQDFDARVRDAIIGGSQPSAREGGMGGRGARGGEEDEDVFLSGTGSFTLGPSGVGSRSGGMNWKRPSPLDDEADEEGEEVLPVRRRRRFAKKFTRLLVPYITKIYVPTDVELSVTFASRCTRELHRNPTMTMTLLAMHTFARGFVKYPRSAFLKLQCGNFIAEHLSLFAGFGMELTNNLQHQENTFSDEFRAIQLTQSLRSALNLRSQADMMHSKNAIAQHREVLSNMHRFWGLLMEPTVNIHLVSAEADLITTNRRVALNHFRRAVQHLSLSNAMLIQSTGEFLQDVLLDDEGSSECFKEARELYEAKQAREMKGTRHLTFVMPDVETLSQRLLALLNPRRESVATVTGATYRGVVQHLLAFLTVVFAVLLAVGGVFFFVAIDERDRQQKLLDQLTGLSSAQTAAVQFVSIMYSLEGKTLAQRRAALPALEALRLQVGNGIHTLASTSIFTQGDADSLLDKRTIPWPIPQSTSNYLPFDPLASSLATSGTGGSGGGMTLRMLIENTQSSMLNVIYYNASAAINIDGQAGLSIVADMDTLFLTESADVLGAAFSYQLKSLSDTQQGHLRTTYVLLSCICALGIFTLIALNTMVFVSLKRSSLERVFTFQLMTLIPFDTLEKLSTETREKKEAIRRFQGGVGTFDRRMGGSSSGRFSEDFSSGGEQSPIGEGPDLGGPQFHNGSAKGSDHNLERSVNSSRHSGSSGHTKESATAATINVPTLTTFAANQTNKVGSSATPVPLRFSQPQVGSTGPTAPLPPQPTVAAPIVPYYTQNVSAAGPAGGIMVLMRNTPAIKSSIKTTKRPINAAGLLLNHPGAIGGPSSAVALAAARRLGGLHQPTSPATKRVTFVVPTKRVATSAGANQLLAAAAAGRGKIFNSGPGMGIGKAAIGAMDDPFSAEFDDVSEESELLAKKESGEGRNRARVSERVTIFGFSAALGKRLNIVLRSAFIASIVLSTGLFIAATVLVGLSLERIMKAPAEQYKIREEADLFLHTNSSWVREDTAGARFVVTGLAADLAVFSSSAYAVRKSFPLYLDMRLDDNTATDLRAVIGDITEDDGSVSTVSPYDAVGLLVQTEVAHTAQLDAKMDALAIAAIGFGNISTAKYPALQARTADPNLLRRAWDRQRGAYELSQTGYGNSDGSRATAELLAGTSPTTDIKLVPLPFMTHLAGKLFADMCSASSTSRRTLTTLLEARMATRERRVSKLAPRPLLTAAEVCLAIGIGLTLLAAACPVREWTAQTLRRWHLWLLAFSALVPLIVVALCLDNISVAKGFQRDHKEFVAFNRDIQDIYSSILSQHLFITAGMSRYWSIYDKQRLVDIIGRLTTSSDIRQLFISTADASTLYNAVQMIDKLHHIANALMASALLYGSSRLTGVDGSLSTSTTVQSELTRAYSTAYWDLKTDMGLDSMASYFPSELTASDPIMYYTNNTFDLKYRSPLEQRQLSKKISFGDRHAKALTNIEMVTSASITTAQTYLTETSADRQKLAYRFILACLIICALPIMVTVFLCYKLVSTAYILFGLNNKNANFNNLDSVLSQTLASRAQWSMMVIAAFLAVAFGVGMWNAVSNGSYYEEWASAKTEEYERQRSMLRLRELSANSSALVQGTHSIDHSRTGLRLRVPDVSTLLISATAISSAVRSNLFGRSGDGKYFNLWKSDDFDRMMMGSDDTNAALALSRTFSRDTCDRILDSSSEARIEGMAALVAAAAESGVTASTIAALGIVYSQQGIVINRTIIPQLLFQWVSTLHEAVATDSGLTNQTDRMAIYADTITSLQAMDDTIQKGVAKANRALSQRFDRLITEGFSLFIAFNVVFVVTVVFVYALVIIPMVRNLLDEAENAKLLLRMIPSTVRDKVPAIAEYIDTGKIDNAAELQKKFEASEKLLQNILPTNIATRLKAGEVPIADTHPSITILFTDLVGFTKRSTTMQAAEIVDFLNELFQQFDTICELLELEKIKTIGDAYFMAGGLDPRHTDHELRVVEAGMFFLTALEEHNERHPSRVPLQMRLGIHSGPVVAGVIGIKKVAYDLWGDSVTIANAMESTGVPGFVHISQTTAEKAQHFFILQPRGPLPREKEHIPDNMPATYLVVGRRAPTPYQHLIRPRLSRNEFNQN